MAKRTGEVHPPISAILADPTAVQPDLLTSTIIDPLSDSDPNDEVPWIGGGVPPEKQRITVMTDHKIVFPDLWMNVYVAGDRSDEVMFANMLIRAACKKATSIETADFVIFTGGVDVDPRLYNAKPHPSTSFSEDRDNADIALYLDCLEKGIPMFGVCRGAQFLHVMNGGRLFQDVDGHDRKHSMIDIKTGEVIENVSSVHHQMCMPNNSGGMELLATAGKSKLRHIDDKVADRGNNADVEAFFYRDTCCLGVQGHPEYRGYNYYTAWCLKQIEHYFMLNTDVDWEKIAVQDEEGNSDEHTVRRVIPDIREQRKLLVQAAAEKACK